MKGMTTEGRGSVEATSPRPKYPTHELTVKQEEFAKQAEWMGNRTLPWGKDNRESDESFPEGKGYRWSDPKLPCLTGHIVEKIERNKRTWWGMSARRKLICGTLGLRRNVYNFFFSFILEGFYRIPEGF